MRSPIGDEAGERWGGESHTADLRQAGFEKELINP